MIHHINHPEPFMPTDLILSKKQASAVHSAMSELNNVGAAGWFRMPLGREQEWADVKQDDKGAVYVGKGPLRRFNADESVVCICGRREVYPTQTTFAEAYGI